MSLRNANMSRLCRTLTALMANRRRFVVGFMLLGLLALMLSGCDVDTPQNTFDPKGEVADKQKDIFLAAMWPALIIMIGVLVATVVIVLRFRRREGDPIPKQTHGNTKLEIAWTIAPAALLLGLGVPMVATLWDISSDPSEDAYPVDVQGQQFQWVFTYPEIVDDAGNPLLGFSGAGDALTIPVGQEVAINLTALDVIHSFWVPKLAGKLDAIPGRTNTMWIKANEPGSYSGQCAELCGIGHADMLLTVTALSEEDFQAWVEEQSAGSNEGGQQTGDGAEDGDTGE